MDFDLGEGSATSTGSAAAGYGARVLIAKGKRRNREPYTLVPTRYILWPMIAGIVTGLAAALPQSLSFLGSRHFAHGRKNSSRELLVLGHVWMGLFGGGFLVWEWPRGGGGAGWGGVE